MRCAANFPTGVRQTTLTDYDFEAMPKGYIISETWSVA